MPSAIVETASKGDALNAPLDADLRNAASVRTVFQAIGNRLKFAENFYDAIKAWMLGGTLSPADNVSLAMGVLKVLTLTSGTLRMGASGILDPQSHCHGTLFERGELGAANRKIGRIFAGSGTVDIDPERYDTIYVSGISGLTHVRLTPDPTTDGLHVRLINASTTSIADLQNAASAGISGTTKSASGFMTTREVTWSAELSAWILSGGSPFDP